MQFCGCATEEEAPSKKSNGLRKPGSAKSASQDSLTGGDQSPESQGSVGIALDGSCVVRLILPGGPAESSGKFHIGDKILEVNGVEVEDSSVTAAFRGPVGTKVVVKRATKEGEVDTVVLVRERAPDPATRALMKKDTVPPRSTGPPDVPEAPGAVASGHEDEERGEDNEHKPAAEIEAAQVEDNAVEDKSTAVRCEEKGTAEKAPEEKAPAEKATADEPQSPTPDLDNDPGTLGFGVTDELVVSVLVHGGAAALSERIHLGDTLLKVNEEPVVPGEFDPAVLTGPVGTVVTLHMEHSDKRVEVIKLMRLPESAIKRFD